jgi:hypothetical protein
MPSSQAGSAVAVVQFPLAATFLVSRLKRKFKIFIVEISRNVPVKMFA